MTFTPSRGEEISIFGHESIDLPPDMILVSVSPPEEPPERQTYHFAWTGLSPDERAQFADVGGPLGQIMDMGHRGYVELWQRAIPPQYVALKPYEMHILLCAAFRSRRGFGFRSFDDDTSIGYCVNPFGALVYRVCKYEPSRIICGEGLNAVEEIRSERTDSFGFGDAYRAYQKLPTQGDGPDDIIRSLRIPGAVERVEDMISRIRPAGNQ